MPSRRDPQRVRIRSVTLRMAAMGTVLLLAPALASWAGDGDSLARQEASDAIHALSGGLGSAPREADELAAQVLTTGWGYSPPPGLHVGVLGWSGFSGSAAGARIDVRLIVDLHDVPAEAGIFAHTAGSTVECWRVTVLALRRDDPVQVVSIPCPASPDRTPHPAPPPALPSDAPSRLRAALATATPATLDARVRTAFPDPGLSIDTLASDRGLYAAVGVLDDRECLMGTRASDSKISVSAGRLEGYEPSCSVTLFFEPSLTG